MGIGELVAFGGGLGVLHVLTGVDHVAAIMTISVIHPGGNPGADRWFL